MEVQISRCVSCGTVHEFWMALPTIVSSHGCTYLCEGIPPYEVGQAIEPKELNLSSRKFFYPTIIDSMFLFFSFSPFFSLLRSFSSVPKTFMHVQGITYVIPLNSYVSSALKNLVINRCPSIGGMVLMSWINIIPPLAHCHKCYLLCPLLPCFTSNLPTFLGSVVPLTKIHICINNQDGMSKRKISYPSSRQIPLMTEHIRRYLRWIFIQGLPKTPIRMISHFIILWAWRKNHVSPPLLLPTFSKMS